MLSELWWARQETRARRRGRERTRLRGAAWTYPHSWSIVHLVGLHGVCVPGARVGWDGGWGEEQASMRAKTCAYTYTLMVGMAIVMIMIGRRGR